VIFRDDSLFDTLKRRLRWEGEAPAEPRVSQAIIPAGGPRSCAAWEGEPPGEPGLPRPDGVGPSQIHRTRRLRWEGAALRAAWEGEAPAEPRVSCMIVSAGGPRSARRVSTNLAALTTRDDGKRPPPSSTRLGQICNKGERPLLP